MDLDTVADELYALTPGEFTAARNARAAEAVRAGDRPLGERIRALPKPTLAAWASNLLVRTRPDETGPLLELGEALRNAYLNVDAAQLRTLSARQRQVTAALAREARQLAASAGQPLGNQALQEVQDTLHAALADPDAAREWASGRLSRPLGAAGFPAVSPSAVTRPHATAGHAPEAAPAPVAEPGRKRATNTTTSTTKAASAPTDLDRARARRERRARADRVGKALREAEEAHEAAEESRSGQQERLDRTTAHQERAARRAADLATRLAAAQDELRDAETAVREARTDLKAADRAVHEAETRLRRARREAEAEEDPDGGDA
ncbi:hypothetical protein [Streptodolium elevatio]|uniref:Transposase n=1 Tax=Streptodolium elevatio TaxID=3157996 RepID=A0ABV3DKZ1_9ACTN